MNAPERVVAAGIDWSTSGDYRRSFGCFPSGVTVVTTVTPDGKPAGLTINSFTSVSLDPPMILWCLKENSKLRDAFRTCSHFAVHVLGHDQQEISRRFCAPVADRFEGLSFHRGAGDVPLLENCSAVIECRRGEVVTWGDHDVINGIVERHGYCDKEPLAFLAGSYGAFQRFPHVA